MEKNPKTPKIKKTILRPRDEESNQQPENSLFWEYYPKIVKILIVFFFSPVWLLPLVILYKISVIYFFAFLMIVVAFLVTWFFPKRQIEYLRKQKANPTESAFGKERDILKLTDDNRKTLIQMVGGMFFVLGLIVTYYTYDLTRQRLLTERYAEAVNLLKTNNDQFIQTAGLFELQNISNESESLHPAIMNVLSLYISNRSQRILNVEKTPDYDCKKFNGVDIDDIAIAFQIINNKNASYEKKDIYLIKLEDPFLQNADLSEGTFQNAIFDKGCLNNAKFNYAKLNNSKFIGTDLTKVNFTGADLQGADLRTTNIMPEQIKVATVDKDTNVPPTPELLEAKRLRIEELNKEKLPPFKSSIPP